MKRNAVFLAVLALALFVLGCQQAPKIEYVKYVNESSVPRISAEEAKKEYDAGNAVFVDSRGQAAWDAEHLPGALVIDTNAPASEYEKLPKGKKIIVYCS